MFDQGFSAKEINRLKSRQMAEEKAAKLAAKWEESERVLNFLRSIPAQKTKVSKEVIQKWHERTKE